MSESVKILLPEIFLSACALLLLMIDVVIPKRRLKASVIFFSLLSLIAALFLVVWSPYKGLAFGMLISDRFSSFFKVIALAGAAVVLLLSEDDPALMGPNSGTFCSLILLSTTGVLFLAGARDLLILFVGLELTTVPLFILAG